MIFFSLYLAAKREGNDIVYLMETKKHNIEIVSSAEARNLWPRLVVDFLQMCVNWRMPTSKIARRVHFELEQPENENIVPHRVTCENILIINIC